MSQECDKNFNSKINYYTWRDVHKTKHNLKKEMMHQKLQKLEKKPEATYSMRCPIYPITIFNKVFKLNFCYVETAGLLLERSVIFI